MAATDTPSKASRWQRARGAAVLAGTAAIAGIRRGWPGRVQVIGGASTLAGVYTLLGLGATLIIGGVAVVVVGALWEGGRI